NRTRSQQPEALVEVQFHQRYDFLARDDVTRHGAPHLSAGRRCLQTSSTAANARPPTITAAGAIAARGTSNTSAARLATSPIASRPACASAPRSACVGNRVSMGPIVGADQVDA